MSWRMGIACGRNVMHFIFNCSNTKYDYRWKERGCLSPWTPPLWVTVMFICMSLSTYSKCIPSHSAYLQDVLVWIWNTINNHLWPCWNCVWRTKITARERWEGFGAYYYAVCALINIWKLLLGCWYIWFFTFRVITADWGVFEYDCDLFSFSICMCMKFCILVDIRLTDVSFIHVC